MSSPKIIPAIRRLGVILLIAALVSLFLFLYYFRYVPANRERMERQGFLMLKQHSNGIQKTVEDLNNFFCHKHAGFTRAKNNNGNGDYEKPFHYNATHYDRKASNISATPCEPAISFDPDNSEILFQFKPNSTDSFVYKTSFENVFEKTLKSGIPDFFQSYFITTRDKRPQVLYHDPELSIISQLQSDSSLKLQNDSLLKHLFYSQFPKICDLEIAGRRYKAFIQPVNLENKSLVLVGLIHEDDYNRKLQAIPFTTISTIIIIFILILIILPYIKIFLISPEEHLGIRDIVLVGTSMLIGTAIIVAILHQLLMQTGAFLRTKEELYSLGNDISTGMHNEIKEAYSELKYLDTSLAGKVKTNSTSANDLNPDSLLITKYDKNENSYFRIAPLSNRSYSNYTVLHWADDSGQQVYKLRLDDNEDIQFINIGTRNYFKRVKAKHLYSFSRGGADSFFLEPVYSRTTNIFETNIAIPSTNKPVASMAALSIQLSSVMNAILPAGYGFYIINNEGLIYYQSQGIITLQENFLEWINDDKELAQTLLTRQSKYLPNQYINSKPYSLFVQPLEDLPLHLVVYHCNENTTASILHVDAYTIFFLVILYVVLFIFCVIFWKYTNYPSRLSQPIYQYNWIKPESTKSQFLAGAKYFLAFHILFAVVFAFITREYTTTIFIGIISPFFVLWTLYILFMHLYMEKKEGNNKISFFEAVNRKFNRIPLGFITAASILYYTIETDWSSELRTLFYLLISVVIVFALPFLIRRLLKRSPRKHTWESAKELAHSKKEKEGRPMDDYIKFWFLCVACVSIIPVYCFFQYAQNKEIALQIKGRQLDLAQKTEKRLSQLDWFEKVLAKRNIDSRKRDSMLFHYGIYMVNHGDSIVAYKEQSLPVTSSPTQVYDTLVTHIGWNYRALDKWTPVQSQAVDQRWKRQDLFPYTRQMSLFYTLDPELRQPDAVSPIRTLKIVSGRPKVFEYFHIGMIGFFFLLVLGIFCAFVFYKVIKKVINKLFTVNYFDKKGKEEWASVNIVRKATMNRRISEEISNVLHNHHLPCDDIMKSLLVLWDMEYDYDRTNKPALNKLENFILYNQYHLCAFYEAIWKSCEKKEQYFLYDMAKDGFTNYKKVELIQLLLYKGLLRYKNDSLIIMSVSFRNFLSVKKGTEEIENLKDEYHVQGSWNNIRTPVLVGIAAIGIFLFITQDGLFQRVGALIPTLSSILGLGSTLLGGKGGGGK